MWGSQGWNQWALQPAMFNDVPHEQIDWAELAKQWIQMQQSTPAEPAASASAPPPPPPQHISPVSLPAPPGHGPLLPEEFSETNNTPSLLKAAPPVGSELFLSERPYNNESEQFLPKTTESSSYWAKTQWEDHPPGDIDDRLWHPPPIETAPSLIGGKETFDYGHMHDNPPLAMQSIDYNHMSDYSYSQIGRQPLPMIPKSYPPPAPEVHYDQYWSQVNTTPAISPMFLKKERVSASVPAEEDAAQLDAAKRKTLPAWIRDGLEKMEQERLKKIEKEKTAKENAEKFSTINSKKDIDSKDSSEIPTSIKSKFDSESEDEENREEDVPTKRYSPVQRRAPSPVEDMRSEEEKRQDMMLKMRRTLTEVLLSVTNSEMLTIAQDIYRKAKSKAPARQLASTTSMSSVAAGLRDLASYGTDSEASEAEEEEERPDSDEELHRRIREKKKLFAIKERKIMADLERREQEERLEQERLMNEKMNERKALKESASSEKSDSSYDPKNNSDAPSHYSKPPEEPDPTPVSSTKIPGIMDDDDDIVPPEKTTVAPTPSNSETAAATNSKKQPDLSPPADSSESESSDSDSESGDSNRHRKRSSHKDSSKSDSRKSSRRDKISSSKHGGSHRKRSRSRDRHKRDRKGGSSGGKKRKRRRSESSSSSSGSSYHRAHRYESGHGYRERRSNSSEDRERRRRRGSVSPSSKGGRRRADGHSSSSRSSRSHKQHDDRKRKESSRHKSRSPSAKVPRKYRSSRSLSSESGSSGKKSKKSRNR